MPNHVTNKLTIIGTPEEVSLVLEKIKGDEQDMFIDFNKISPMPKELEGTCFPSRIVSQEEFDEQQRRIDNDELTDNERNYGLQRRITQDVSDKLIEEFGADNWYDWRNSNWGTKWNAYEQSMEDDNIICFDTAWCTPFEIIQELSFMFPDLKFEVIFADEDFGYNVGRYILKNGSAFNNFKPKGGSIEAKELAIEVNGDEAYWLGDVVCGSIKDNGGELTDYEIDLLNIAHKRGYLFEEYPVVALEKLKEFAIGDGQTGRVIQIEKLLNKN